MICRVLYSNEMPVDRRWQTALQYGGGFAPWVAFAIGRMQTANSWAWIQYDNQVTPYDRNRQHLCPTGKVTGDTREREAEHRNVKGLYRKFTFVR